MRHERIAAWIAGAGLLAASELLVAAQAGPDAGATAKGQITYVR